MKVIKLSRKQVKAYEKISGFKTTGDVKLHIGEDDAFKLYEGLLVSKDKKRGPGL